MVDRGPVPRGVVGVVVRTGDAVAGAHYDPDDASGYRAAIDLATGIRPEAARARALDFDTARFVDDVRDWVLGEPAQAGASSRPNKVSSALG